MPAVSKFSDETKTKILQAMRMGLFAEQAASLAGIGQSTLDDWLRDGRDGREHYASFVAEFERAKAIGEQVSVAQIQKAAGAGQWQAAAWILERRHPKRWGPKVRLIVEEEQREFLDRLRARLSPEAYAAVIRAASDEIEPIDAGASQADDAER